VFLTKPFMGVSASGCHHNLSLWRGGDHKLNKLGYDSLPGMDDNFNYLKGGENTFCRSKVRRSRARIGLHCIGGLIKTRRRADGDRLFDCQFLPAPLGHGLLGARLCRLGLPEPHLCACAFRRQGALNTARSIRP